MWKYFVVYLIIINVVAFAMMGIDKKRAINHKWRIPERSLFISALLLGSIGSIAGMKIFRHKTKHQQFVIGMPLILIIQIIITIELIVHR